jgi:hypothetical protein
MNHSLSSENVVPSTRKTIVVVKIEWQKAAELFNRCIGERKFIFDWTENFNSLIIGDFTRFRLLDNDDVNRFLIKKFVVQMCWAAATWIWTKEKLMIEENMSTNYGIHEGLRHRTAINKILLQTEYIWWVHAGRHEAKVDLRTVPWHSIRDVDDSLHIFVHWSRYDAPSACTATCQLRTSLVSSMSTPKYASRFVRLVWTLYLPIHSNYNGTHGKEYSCFVKHPQWDC